MSTRVERRPGSPIWSAVLLPAALILTPACMQLERRTEPLEGGLAEPDVFEIIRASNSHATLEFLRERYQEELEHARVIEENIAHLIAAEEGLSMRLKAEQQRFEKIQADLRALTIQQEDASRQYEQVKQQKTGLDELVAGSRSEVDALNGKLEANRTQQTLIQQEIEAEEVKLRELQMQLLKAQDAVATAMQPLEKDFAELQAVLQRIEQRETGSSKSVGDGDSSVGNGDSNGNADSEQG